MQTENLDEEVVPEPNELEEPQETDQQEENLETETEEEDEQPEVEPWQEVDKDLPPVPVKKHIVTKQKLKGRISERDDEIVKLKAKIDLLEKSSIKDIHTSKTLKRPSYDDFDTDQEYQNALTQYENDLVTSKFQELEFKRQQEQAYSHQTQLLTKAVEEHYERAAELIETAGISPEVYQASDQAVRQAVNSISPGRGDIIVDMMIANIGQGSDKVMYYIGRNQTALSQFKSLLLEDPSGLKASLFVGRQLERLTTPKKMKTRAPSPAPSANGDSNLSSSSRAFFKKYKEAHKKGNSQQAWDLRRQARKAGVNTSEW